MARSRHAQAVCLAVSSFAAIAAVVATPSVAAACGGCFVPPSSSTVVTGHRMVVSISPDQTVLWDQIQYSGDPAEFAWVLPVARGARIETSTAAFFEVLEAATQRSIFAPPVDCGGSGFGCANGGLGFRAQADAAGGDGGLNEAGAPDPVEVLHSGTVGPYETVTLATDEPGALNQWLVDHNFNVDPTTQPIIDQYVAEGFDFIALRLQPGKGVSQMTPVRVVTQGAGSVLPLRMVAIGTGAETPIVLYVMSEGRYATQNFPDAKLPAQLVSWDFETSESNYADLRKEALKAEGGRAFLTAYAQKGPVFSEQFDDVTFQSSDTLMNLYMRQLVSNDEADRLCVVEPPRGNGRIVNPCPEGVPFDSPDCGEVQADEIDVRTLRCDGADDFATALVGMHPEVVWVTRLEANLPREALDTDLTLKAADDQKPVGADLFAQIAVNPEAACPQNNSGVLSLKKLGEPPQNLPVGHLIGLALVAAGAAFVARRTAPRAAGITRRDR
jgi:hypothetical protein